MTARGLRRSGAARVVPDWLIDRPGGRQVAVQDFGDPDGPVVFYFHGFPACRMEAGLVPEVSVRLLAPDRPGYGRSGAMPGRSLQDWPADVAAIADRLGVDRFHVIGLSGGAPYAVACGALLGARVRSLALVSPVPPPQEVAGRADGVVQLYRMARRPRSTRALFRSVRALIRLRLVTPRMVLGRLLAADRAVMTPDRMRMLGQVWDEALAPGIEGAAADAAIYGSNWSALLDRVSVPASLWCGGEDALVPEALMQPYRRIPGIAWHSLPDEGHFSLPLRQVEPILAELLGQSPAGPVTGRGG